MAETQVGEKKKPKNMEVADSYWRWSRSVAPETGWGGHGEP